MRQTIQVSQLALGFGALALVAATGCGREPALVGVYEPPPEASSTGGIPEGPTQAGGGASSAGTEFWLTFAQNLDLAFNGAPAFSLLISSEQGATGEVEVFLTGVHIPFDIAAGTEREIFVSKGQVLYPQGSEVVAPCAIRVTAARPVRVVAVHYRKYFSEASRILPISELGQDYRVIAKEDGPAGVGNAFFSIVATRPDTEVTITLSQETLALHEAGAPFKARLAPGEVYQVLARKDLSGSRIEANAPIAVFGGATTANVSCLGADSHLFDQLLPSSRLGTRYVVVPFKGQGGDPVTIVAIEDGTHVRLDCGEPKVLSAGEVFSTTVSVPTEISSDLPIAVAQFDKSESCNTSLNGDPNMLVLTPAALTNGESRFTSIATPNPAIPDGFPIADSHYVEAVIFGAQSLALDGSTSPLSCLPCRR
jgi:hypothetical protein